MPNYEHLAKLKEGVEVWYKWRSENPDISPNLTGANLNKARLEGFDLTNATLTGAYLNGAHLTKTHLNGANLNGAHLDEANLEQAMLNGAHLYGADLIRANLKHASLNAAHLEGARLVGANLNGAWLIDTHLEGANLNEANLEGAELYVAHFEGTQLNKTHFEGARLNGTNFDNTNVAGIIYSRKTKFKGIRLGSCYGSPMFRRFAQDQEFLEELQDRSWTFSLGKKEIPIPWGKYLYSLWNVTADCGRTPWLWMLWSVLTPLVFAVRFFDLGEEAFNIGYGVWTKKTVLFYSIDNFVSLGIGGMQPVTTSAIFWMTLEGIAGLVMVAGLISILVNKIARRS